MNLLVGGVSCLLALFGFRGTCGEVSGLCCLDSCRVWILSLFFCDFLLGFWAVLRGLGFLAGAVFFCWVWLLFWAIFVGCV